METGEISPLESQPTKEKLVYQPKISVVVSVLNRAHEIPRLLESFNRQAYPGEKEIIVADGGSTDRTIEICKAAGATIINSPDGKSIGASARAGCEAATGEILVYTGSDFILSPHYFEAVAKAFSDPEVIASHGPIEMVYQGKPSTGLIQRLTQRQLDKDWRQRREKKQPMLISFAVLRSVYNAIGGFDPRTNRIEEPVIYQLLWEMPGKIVFDENQKLQTELPWQKNGRPDIIKKHRYHNKYKPWMPITRAVIQERKQRLSEMRVAVKTVIQERKQQLIQLFSEQLYLHDRKIVSSRVKKATE